MAMTYEESAMLMQNATFVSRVKVACLRYADFITIEASTVPAHATRIKWAQSVQSNPEAMAIQLTPSVVLDAQVQQDGAGITDPALQTSVEATVNKMI